MASAEAALALQDPEHLMRGEDSLDKSPGKEQVLIRSISWLSIFTNSSPQKVISRFYRSTLVLSCVYDELVIDNHGAERLSFGEGGRPLRDRANEAEAFSDRYISPSTYLLGPCDWRDVRATMLAEQNGEAPIIRSSGPDVANADCRDLDQIILTG